MDSTDRTTSDRSWLVATAAALWGTDALLRLPLAGQISSAGIVFWEHLIVVALLLPWLPAAFRAFRSARPAVRWSLVAIGAGASALATALFTQAMRLGDPVTPLVMQKLQPLIVLVVAAALLGERLRAGYWWYAVPALGGAWLMSFPNPFDVRLRAATAALLALGAAALWAVGTVLGRYVTHELASRDVTVLRFAVGLPAAALVLAAQGAPPAVTGAQLGPLVALALIPGLFSLVLYYLGLRATTASRATLAELAFPATAALIGVGVLGASLTGTQWIGLAVVAGSVTALGLRSSARRPVVVTPEPVGGSAPPGR